MNLWNGTSRRARAEANEQFARFLQLHRGQYTRLVLSVPSEPSTVDSASFDHERIASACRQWAPLLSDPFDREFCTAIAELHEAFARRDQAMESMYVAFLAEHERERLAPYGQAFGTA